MISYTGAPYFSAHAAAVFGADLSHIICEKNAATVIKSYSPNLMVHPYLYESDNVPDAYKNNKDKFVQEKVLPKVKSLLSRVHVAVVGPGLGRDSLMLDTLEIVIKYLREKEIPIIIDADALFLISQKPELIKGYDRAILTPNVVEFKRLAEALKIDTNENKQEEEAIKASKTLGNVTIVRKGATDLIVKGEHVIKSDIKGSDRRAGGQGDTLTGTIATLVAWGQAYKSQLWEHPNELEDDSLFLLAGFGGSVVTRYAAREAFKSQGRALQATDVHAQVGHAYQVVFEAPEEQWPELGLF